MLDSGLIPSSATQRLKFATKSLHSKLDKNLSIAHPQAGIEHYLHHLKLTNRWLNNINARLIFRREHDIKAALSLNNYFLDLIYIDFKASDSVKNFQESLLETKFKPEISMPFFWGIDYVVKGSALGAKHLHGTLSKTLTDHPLYFFDEASIHGLDRWSDFNARLEKNVTNEIDLKCAERGAIWAFESIIALNLDMPYNNKNIGLL